MNLIIDIGNTVAKLAVFDRYELVEVCYDCNHSLDRLSEICGKYPVERGIVGTVVTLNRSIRNQLDKLGFTPVYLDEKTPLPITNCYKSPQTLGCDRIAAVVGASGIFPGKDILVIDAGTALTYEFIDAGGNYLGGNISPGLNMRFKALNIFTDKLPLVDKNGEIMLFGNNTESAIRSGVIKGMELEMNGYITLLKEKYPELLVFLTGGDEFSFDTKLKNMIFADKFLVLKGLNRILNYNDRL